MATKQAQQDSVEFKRFSDDDLTKWNQAVSMPDCSGIVTNGDYLTGHVVTVGNGNGTNAPGYAGGGTFTPYIPNGITPWIGGSPAPLQQPPMVGTDFDISEFLGKSCQTHKVTVDLMEIKDDHVVGTCETCGERIFIPRVAGAFSFEQAGVLMGRAMSLIDEDEEDISGLLLEIQEAQEKIDKDIRRHKLAMEMLQIAKNMAKKAVLKIAEPIE